MTYTYVVLKISPLAYEEIKSKLEAAGYQHAFHDEGEDGIVIDMHGIAVAREKRPAASAVTHRRERK